jgi:hypothetical protein
MFKSIRSLFFSLVLVVSLLAGLIAVNQEFNNGGDDSVGTSVREPLPN